MATPRNKPDRTESAPETYTAIVDTTAQSVALTRAGIPATTPAHLRAAPREAARDYLTSGGPVVVYPVRQAAEVVDLLRSLDVPYHRVGDG